VVVVLIVRPNMPSH